MSEQTTNQHKAERDSKTDNYGKKQRKSTNKRVPYMEFTMRCVLYSGYYEGYKHMYTGEKLSLKVFTG